MNSLDNLRYYNVKRCKEAYGHFGEWGEVEFALAVAGETGEMCNLIKKRKRGDEIPIKAVADEMADIVIYLDLLAATMGIDLHTAIATKFNETSERVGSPIKIPY